MARLFISPRKVRVQTSITGEPASLLWRGRWEPVRACARWRLEDDWWRQGGEVVREYYKLQTASATICVVFHDEVEDGWYLEKILD
jgi:hypothetical protein